MELGLSSLQGVYLEEQPSGFPLLSTLSFVRKDDHFLTTKESYVILGSPFVAIGEI